MPLASEERGARSDSDPSLSHGVKLRLLNGAEARDEVGALALLLLQLRDPLAHDGVGILHLFKQRLEIAHLL